MTSRIPSFQQSEPPADWSDTTALCGRSAAVSTIARTPEHAAPATSALSLPPHDEETVRLWESLSQMISSIAHGVKTPLGILLMGTEFLDKKVNTSDPAVGRVLDDMRNAIGRANGIVRALLDLSCTEKPEPDREDLHALVEAAAQRLARDLAAKRLTLVREFAAAPPAIPLDRHQCLLALQHLLVNAIAATPPGGIITIRTSVIAPELGVNTIRLLIEDSGPGLPPAVLKRAFEPFFTTDKGGSKPGLGLTVARRIIEANGGRVALANRPGGGAAVTILFGVGLAPEAGALPIDSDLPHCLAVPI